MTLERSLSEILDECIQRVTVGGESLDACLADYPQFEEELRDELDMALAFTGAFEFTLDQDKKRAARLRMHEAIERGGKRRFGFRLPLPSGLFATWTRAAAVAAVGAFALVGSGTGTVMAAQGSIPGDLLYPVKRAGEETQLALAFSDARRIEVLDVLVERRVEEIDAVSAAGRERFVPALADQVIKKTDRAQRLAAGPVTELVDSIPAGNVPAAEPTDDEVSAKRILRYREELGKIENRLAELEQTLAHAETLQQVKRARNALNDTKERLDNLIERVQTAHESEVPPATVAPRLPTTDVAPERDADERAGGATRAQGVVHDVVLHQRDGKLVRVDVEVVLENGRTRVVHIQRGGAALLMNGEPVGLKKLQIGQNAVLGISDTGEVRVISIRPLAIDRVNGDSLTR